jgi:Uma2 family endonuclease
MPISARTYERVALEDPEGQWELYDGCLRQKPDMTVEHNQVSYRLVLRLGRQLDEREYEARMNAGRTRRRRSYFIPDVFIVPAAMVQRLKNSKRGALESYDEPLPLVIEVWSRSTGGYDARGKLPEYQRRGDLEIWYVHPYERTLTAWRRQPDGSYVESVHRTGAITLAALPHVSIDLDTLFD